MPDNILRAGLHRAVDGIEVPQEMWRNIRTIQKTRLKRRVYLRRTGAVAAVILLVITLAVGSITSAVAKVQKSWFLKNAFGTFTLTLVQDIGEKVAEISPTMFLPTTLSHAKQVAKIPIELPSYLPVGVTLDDETPTLVGRVGSTETVAIRVTEKSLVKDPRTGKVRTVEFERLDIRQTNAPDVTMVDKDGRITVDRVKIGDYEGLIALQTGVPDQSGKIAPKSVGQPLYVIWSDGKYWYRVSGVSNREELVKIAESMR